MKKIIFLVSTFSFSGILFSQIKARVIGISDGDTITVLLENNTQKKLRLAEVDCPENKQPFGKNAKQFTSSQIFGKNIIFYETDQDRYGRTVGKVYYDSNKYLSAEIIKAGYGWWYYQYSDNPTLGNYEENVRKLRIGLWKDNNPINPSVWRKLSKELK